MTVFKIFISTLFLIALNPLYGQEKTCQWEELIKRLNEFAEDFEPKGNEVVTYTIKSITYSGWSLEDSIIGQEQSSYVGSESIQNMYMPVVLLLEDSVALEVDYEQELIFVVDKAISGFGFTNINIDTLKKYGSLSCNDTLGFIKYRIDINAKQGFGAYEIHFDKSGRLKSYIIYSNQYANIGTIMEPFYIQPRMEMQFMDLKKEENNTVELIKTNEIVEKQNGKWMSKGRFTHYQVKDIRTIKAKR